MDILTLDQELRSNKIRPGYLLVGPERHLVLTARKNILKTVFRDQDPSPDIYSALETSCAAILDVFKTPSMFSCARCVVVEEAHALKKKDLEEIKKIFKNPLPKAVLLLIAETLSKGFLDGLPASVSLVECKKLYPRQVLAWINIEARNLNIPISKEAASFLADCVGGDLGRLSQTLETASLYVGQRKIVGLEDVEVVAGLTAQKNIFDLTKSIGEKNPLQAVKILETVLDGGEEPLRVLGMIARHCRLLAQALVPDFSKKLGVHPFFAKEYALQTRRWSSKGWKGCFATLALCDRTLKSSRHKPRAILEKLIWELCR